RHGQQAVELHSHAALHDELVQTVDPSGERTANDDHDGAAAITRQRVTFLFLLCVSASVSAQANAVRWNDINRQPPAWYATEAARVIADNVLKFQTPSGGWPKNVDMTRPPDAAFLASTAMDVRDPTIDNGATYTQLRFLAKVYAASPDHDERSPHARSLFRGFDYLLAAQYENGGWPQYFPPHEGYYTHITFNDDAMIGVMELLRD